MKTSTNATPEVAPVAWAYQHEEAGWISLSVNRQHKMHRYVEIPLYIIPPDQSARIAELEELLHTAKPYIKYPRNSPDAYVIAHNKMIERIEAALKEKP